ncbi:hypothetical protein [Cognatiyoonia sp.]
MTKKVVALKFVALGLAACAEQDAIMKDGDAIMSESMMSDTMMADK